MSSLVVYKHSIPTGLACPRNFAKNIRLSAIVTRRHAQRHGKIGNASAGQVVTFLAVLCDIEARNLYFRADAHADHQIYKLQNNQRTN